MTFFQEAIVSDQQNIAFEFFEFWREKNNNILIYVIFFCKQWLKHIIVIN